VGSVKKSTATRSRTWLVRNVRQVCDGGVGRFGSRRETVRSAISMPSFRSLTQGRPPVGPVYGELLAQGQVLRGELAMAAEQKGEEPK
jgi:hypothetical protein